LQNKEDVIVAAKECMPEEKNALTKRAHAIVVANLVTFLPFVETQATQTPNLLQDFNQEINQDISQETNQDISQEINRDPHHQL
jgi:hypothetical protein